jgi:hypothetical protein
MKLSSNRKPRRHRVPLLRASPSNQPQVPEQQAPGARLSKPDKRFQPTPTSAAPRLLLCLVQNQRQTLTNVHFWGGIFCSDVKISSRQGSRKAHSRDCCTAAREVFTGRARRRRERIRAGVFWEIPHACGICPPRPSGKLRNGFRTARYANPLRYQAALIPEPAP